MQKSESENEATDTRATLGSQAVGSSDLANTHLTAVDTVALALGV